MLFYEPLFLFVFLPTLYILYLLSGFLRPLRTWIILVSSFAFYSWSDPFVPAIVLVSAVIDCVIATAMVRSPLSSTRKHLLLAVGVSINILMLIYYKYVHFLVQSINVLLHAHSLSMLRDPDIRLPIGLSFITFEKISYLVDVKRGISRPAKNISGYLLYVFFFPKLLAGPIIKYHDLEAQLSHPLDPNIEDFSSGCLRFMLGVVKKTLLADTLAHGADVIFSSSPDSIGFLDTWFGVACFTFQIYFDFSAYSDMAIGLARIFGFRLLENFNMPYIARSMTDFWRRWHISLTSWIREYLYIALGGNRVGPMRHLANLWVCFLVSGLWHGAAWTYVAWGIYNGFFLILDKLFLLRIFERLSPAFANIATFIIVMFGWTLFRATSLSQAGTLLLTMVHPSKATTIPLFVTNDIKVALITCAVICSAPRIPGFERLCMLVASRPFVMSGRLALALLFIMAVGKSVAEPFVPFLYFRF